MINKQISLFLSLSLSPFSPPSPHALPPPTQVNGYEEVLVETINLCCHYFENSMYMVPKEKYMLLKVSNISAKVLFTTHNSRLPHLKLQFEHFP